MWARLCMRCMPAVLCRLYHYISARQAVGSACDLLFYITALPFYSLLDSPPALSPHHLLSTLQLSMLSMFPSSALWISLPTCAVPSKFLLTHKRWSGGDGWLAGAYVTETDSLVRMKVLSEHYSSTVIHKTHGAQQPTVALIRKTKACMWSESYYSTYKHVWDVNT